VTVSRIVISNDPQDLLPKDSLYTFALIAIGIESEKWAKVIAKKVEKITARGFDFHVIVTTKLLGVGNLTSLGLA
jgi:hypothetical protein